MEIYHKNKDQHDKGLSDEILKDLLELQRINKIEPKKMDQITDVSSLFKYDMEMRIGDKIRRFKAFSEWIGLYNAASYISEIGKYTEEKKDENGNRRKEVVEVIQAVGIQTKEKIPYFPEGIKPNLVIRKRSIDTYQYIWVLKFPVNIKIKSSWHLLKRALAHLYPGAKPIYKTKGIMVPGIKELQTGYGWVDLDEFNENKYTFSYLWEAIGKCYPVRGRALKKYLRNCALYCEGLKTTKQFIAIRRLNSLRRLILDKKALLKLRWEEMLKILYWYWCFAIDVGYQTEEIEKQITDIFKMKGIIMPISLIREAKTDSTYRIRNKTLNETFGLDHDRYFHEPKERVTRAEYLKGMEEKRMELTKEITILFYKGYSSTETAKMLNVSMATVARRKNDAKKLGWIPFRGKFFQSALSWKLEA